MTNPGLTPALNFKVGDHISLQYIENGDYTRTFNRHDYSVAPSKKTILDKLQEKNIEVISVGKINDIFSGQGISKHFPSNGDANGMDITIDLAIEKTDGTYESGKLLRDVSGMAKYHKNELDAAGFTVEKDGHIKIDEALIIQSANEGTLSENLQKLNSFKSAMVRRADNISINPMAYVDKKLIAYPHPTKNYPNPYVTSRYSGMMFSTVV